MSTSDIYQRQRGQYGFWMSMGWDEWTAKKIANACSDWPDETNPGRNGPNLRGWFRACPDWCVDVRHPMFWFVRGYDVGEAVEKAVMAVSFLGNVQPEQPKRPDESMEMLEIFAQTMVVQQHEIMLQQGACDYDYQLSDETTDQQQHFNPDDFPRFGQ